MSAAHTPGPWRVTLADSVRQPDVLPCIDAKDGEVACGVFHEADARLIAAAPALLEALEHAYASLAWAKDALQVTHDCEFTDSLERVRAALALAQAQGGGAT